MRNKRTKDPSKTIEQWRKITAMVISVRSLLEFDNLNNATNEGRMARMKGSSLIVEDQPEKVPSKFSSINLLYVNYVYKPL